MPHLIQGIYNKCYYDSQNIKDLEHLLLIYIFNIDEVVNVYPSSVMPIH